jgi:hypothetical protein
MALFVHRQVLHPSGGAIVVNEAGNLAPGRIDMAKAGEPAIRSVFEDRVNAVRENSFHSAAVTGAQESYGSHVAPNLFEITPKVPNV